MIRVAHRFDGCHVVLLLLFFRRLWLMVRLRVLIRWVLEMRLMLLLEVIRSNIVHGSIILYDDHVLVAPMALCRRHMLWMLMRRVLRWMTRRVLRWMILV